MLEHLDHAFSEDIITICNRLHAAGFEAYIVGGAVRDALLKKALSDIDLCSNATPDEIEVLFPKAIPTGKAFGTLTLLLNKTQKLEITTYRSDGPYSNQRHPDRITFETNISIDLARRDFTINALAYDPIESIFIDEHKAYKLFLVLSFNC